MRLRFFAFAAALCALAAPSAAQAAAPGINVAGLHEVDDALKLSPKHVRIFAPWKDFEPRNAADYPTPADKDAKGDGTMQNLINLTDAYDDAIRKILKNGATPIFVVETTPDWAKSFVGANVHIPPKDVKDYASFFGEFVKHNAEVVKGLDEKDRRSIVYEVWNEPDEKDFWPNEPDADKYTQMLKESWVAAKSGGTQATILTGPTTGNNYQWIQKLYDRGAKGFFDGVSVHTDTACLVTGPDRFYRDEQGKLAQFTFIGYRSVREVMLAHGDDKGIWMTEIGWSSSAPNRCERGSGAGKKGSGVDEATQARFLKAGYQCLASDPYVVSADWFTYKNATSGIEELKHYGLFRADGSEKPALAEYKAITQGPNNVAADCGDFTPPTIEILSPLPGQQFDDKIDIKVRAADHGVGWSIPGIEDGAPPQGGRVTFQYDAENQIRNFTGDALGNDKLLQLAPWFGAGQLGLGQHTIIVKALDANGNESRATVDVTKVAPGTIKANVAPVFTSLSKKVVCKRATVTVGKGKRKRRTKAMQCAVGGFLSKGANAAGPSITKKVRAEWQFFNKKRRWVTLGKVEKPANKKNTFKYVPKFKGRWRVKLVYVGDANWKPIASKAFTFTVRKLK